MTGKQRLSLSEPGHPDQTPAGSLFEASGSNEDVPSVVELSGRLTGLPTGAYRFRVTLDGITRTARVSGRRRAADRLFQAFANWCCLSLGAGVRSAQINPKEELPWQQR